MKTPDLNTPIAFYIELPSKWLVEQIGRRIQKPQTGQPVDLEQVVRSQISAIAPRAEPERIIVKQCRRRRKK